MLVDWRVGDDLELLAELPDGALTFDVIAGVSFHDISGAVDFDSRKLQAWLN